MTFSRSPFLPSSRPSNRVDQHQAAAAEFSGLHPRKGAESLSSTSAPTTRATAPQRRVSSRRLEDIRAELSERDLAIIRDVAAFHFLKTGHLIGLHFTGHATPDAAGRAARSVLSRLSKRRLIDPLERRIGGFRAGSAGFVWRLGPAGERLLREQDSPGARSRWREPSLRFFDHTLAVADCYLTAATLAKEGQLELLKVEPEPASWRRYLGAGGSPETLKPDLAMTTAQGDYSDSWMVEVDRATESVPTVLGQCAQYERYRKTGTEQHAHGVFPLVVWVVPHVHRAEQLTDAIRSTRDLDPQLYRVSTTAEFGSVLIGGSS